MGRFQAAALCRELGAELRKYRKAAGLSETELADKAGWWPAKISRMESGNINASDIDVVQYLAYCGCWLGEVHDVIDLCRLAEKEIGYWMNPHGHHLEDSVRSLIFHETTARASISYEPNLVPGLLQTEAYARMMILRDRWRTVDNVEFCVRARMDRQGAMYRPRPGHFTFYVHEHALRPVIDDPAIMQEQLLALTLLDGVPHVAVRVVPMSATFGGAFRVFQYAAHEPLVYLDVYSGGMFLEDREYVDGFLNLVPEIAHIAMSEGQSREYLATLANVYDRGSLDARVEEEQL